MGTEGGFPMGTERGQEGKVRGARERAWGQRERYVGIERDSLMGIESARYMGIRVHYVVYIALKHFLH